MKKLITLLFALLACSWTLLSAANVKVRVLIPTDSEFATTSTIVFSWEAKGGASPATDIVLTREGTSRWWGATVIIPDATDFTYSIYTETSPSTKDVANIGGWSPSSYVAKDKPELNIEIQVLADDSNPAERYFLAGEVEATAQDHDYRISDLKVQDIGNGVTITWNANNLAPGYYVCIMEENNNWDFEDVITVTEGKFTYYYDGTDDIHLGTFVFYPCNYDGTDMQPYVRMFVQDLNINFVNPEKIIQKSLKAVQKDNTIEVSWDHYPAAVQYYVGIEYSNWHKEQFVMPKFVPAKDGKYTVVFDELPCNGNYGIYFSANSENYNVLADITSFLAVTGLPSLGEVELRTLIPTDNDMDITHGVWFEWQDLETKTSTFVKADMDADGVWFSKKITTDKSAVQFRVCNTSDASGANSEFSPIINTTNACFEMRYQNYSSWELREADCDAPDHDYRITNLQTKLSDPVSLITFTLTAQDYAPAYKFEMRKSGVTYYQTLDVIPYEGSNVFTCALPFTAAGDYDYRVSPIDLADYSQLADEVTGTVTLATGNMNMPTNLAATVMADKQTVTFSWTAPTTGQVDHYAVGVNEFGEEFRSESVTGTSCSVKFYGTRTHCTEWYVYAYDANGVVLAKASRGDCFDIESPDYTPTNLNVTVDGNTATLTWETPKDVQTCQLFAYDASTGFDIVITDVQGKNGQFSASYTLEEEITVAVMWSVTAMSPEGVAMSISVDGEMFIVVGKKPDPRVPQTKEMTPTIGYLSWDESHSTWSATVYEYDAAHNPLFVFIFSVPGKQTTIPTQITLTNNTDDSNLFTAIPSGGGESDFGDVTKNANLTISYNGGIRTKDDGAGGKEIYVLAKVSGEMSSDFGDKLIVKQPADFIEFLLSGVEPPSAIENLMVNGQCQNGKFIKDGHLFIQRGDQIFTITGARVK